MERKVVLWYESGVGLKIQDSGCRYEGINQEGPKKYQHEMPAGLEHQPNKHTIPNYVEKFQLTEPEDTSHPLGPKDINNLQEIIESLLFYGQGVDGTLIPTLNELASSQSQGTEATKVSFLN